VTSPGPYAAAADIYWRAGWRGILPLPANKKHDPPKGYTGAAGHDPYYPEVWEWVTGPAGAGNIALRMPSNVIGIDVDDYGDKRGGDTLTLAEAAHGVLPPTWRSTSRDDGVSGIRLYRIPEGLAWPGEVGASIELIQTRHRYCVVWPSIHPEGRTYRWISPDGLVSTAVPDPDDLPLLPDAWVQAYTGGEFATTTVRVDVKHADAVGWLAGTEHATKAMCTRMTKALDQHAADLTGSAHNSTRDATLRIARLAEEGHHGAVHALAGVRDAFLTEATSPNRDILGSHRRTDSEAVYEFGELITSAVGVVLGSPSGVQTCDCYGQITGAIVPERGASLPVDGTAALDPLAQPAPDDVQVTESEPKLRFKDGASFILDAPEGLPNIWGEGDESLWARGEALMICGPPGVGKTTLTGQLVRGLLGLQDEVLGLPVEPTAAKVLYLAMDRPAQIARGLRRAFKESERAVLAESLLFWEGPPPGDVAKHPSVLLSLAQLAEADIVVIDSVKDAAVGLTEDEVAAGYNRARQNCLAHGVEVLELHHMVKRGAGGNKPTELADVYGSAWLTAGAGSVVLLWGAAGDPVVSMTHLKQPAGEVGPWQLEHDHSRGTTSIFHGADILTLASSYGDEGISPTAAAVAMFDAEKPTEAQKKKAARKLQRLVDQGHLERYEKARDVWGGGKPQTFYRVPGIQRRSNDATPSGESNDTNDGPTTHTLDLSVKSNDESNDANDTTGPTTVVPPSIEGDDGGRSSQHPRNRAEKPYPELDCNGCGEAKPAAIITTFKGYCAECHRERS
jgi:KaiC/GvpD/RAD55 family RecA-like ATPase